MNLAVAAIPNGHRAPPCSTNASPPASVQRLERTPVEFFFVYSLLACDLMRSWRGYVQSVSCPLSAQWRLVASTPFALRPGLSREYVVRTKEITKEKREE